MKALSKLLYAVMLMAVLVFNTGCITDPKLDNCDALFAQNAPTRGTLIVDGQVKFNNNFMPGDTWAALHLDDGTEHTYRFYATDPSVYDTGTRRFRVMMGVTETYGGLNYNKVINIR